MPPPADGSTEGARRDLGVNPPSGEDIVRVLFVAAGVVDAAGYYLGQIDCLGQIDEDEYEWT